MTPSAKVDCLRSQALQLMSLTNTGVLYPAPIDDPCAIRKVSPAGESRCCAHFVSTASGAPAGTRADPAGADSPKDCEPD